MLSNQNPPIGLKEFIDQIKAELLADHDTDNPLFVIGEVTLEINITVARNAHGGVDFAVVQGTVDKTMTDVQKVAVKLEPLVTPDELRAGLDDAQKTAAGQKLIRTYNPKQTRGE